jgi:hypothetical protein
MLKECLVCSSMRLGVPFIAPRQLGAVESNPGRISLPSVGWCTGHCPVLILFLFWRNRPLKIWSGWCTGHGPVHTGQSGAHRTVRCPLLTVGLATRHARIAWLTVGLADRWLTRQSGAPPVNLVNFSRTPPFSSREQPVDQRQCTTGQSGAPRLSRVLAARAKSFPFIFSLILALIQIC